MGIKQSKLLQSEILHVNHDDTTYGIKSNTNYTLPCQTQLCCIHENGIIAWIGTLDDAH